MAYHSFMVTFNETVDKTCENEVMKFTRLLQYTSGKAHEAISLCVLMGAKGYEAARKILKDRFGNNHLVTEYILSIFKEGKPIQTAEQWQEFADQLNNEYLTLKQMGKAIEVDSHSIVKIVDRFPQYVKNRWRRRAKELKEGEDRYPSFEEFVNFVAKEAREAADPVYGASKIGSNVGANVNMNKKSTFATGLGSHKCPLCREITGYCTAKNSSI